ncbi:MAG: DUF58 domain-containing protein [Xanthomonadales bacterium]|nr:DUF58 domain-containing protein [Xanthomonadales bacterium]
MFFARARRRLLHSFNQAMERMLSRRARAPLPRTLSRQSIYILPTRFGCFYALVMIVIVGGSLNFNNNSALLFGFLFVAIAIVSMHQTFGNLNGLSLVQVRMDSCHAGDRLHLWMRFATDGDPRNDVRIDCAASGGLLLFADDNEGVVSCAIDAERRGWQSLPPVRVSTVWPFGLFYAWGYFWPDARALIYPRPERGRPELPEDGDGLGLRRRRSYGDDFAGLRDYVSGDSPRRIAWRASAKRDSDGGQLLVRTLEHPSAPDLVFDLATAPGNDTEQKLSRLTRWVLMAQQAERRYKLVLGEKTLGPDSGPAHRDRCLGALALYGIG